MSCRPRSLGPRACLPRGRGGRGPGEALVGAVPPQHGDKTVLEPRAVAQDSELGAEARRLRP
jgi:hypothetical protein